MKVSELLSTEDKWTQGAFARNKNETPVDYYSEKAVKWCLVGATHKCYPDYEEMDNMINKIRSATGGNYYQYNDTHTYEEVMKLVKELDI